MIIHLGLCVVLVVLLDRSEAAYRCTGESDRTSNCQDYILRCEDDFRMFRAFTTTRTCPGDLFFSDVYGRCIDPSTLNYACPNGGGGGSSLDSSVSSSDSDDSDISDDSDVSDDSDDSDDSDVSDDSDISDDSDDSDISDDIDVSDDSDVSDD